MPFIKGNKIRNTGKTRFKKGRLPWNKGLTKDNEIIRLQAETHSIKMRNMYKEGKIKPWNKGKPMPDDVKLKISKASLAHPHRNYWLGKRRINQMGPLNRNWKGGSSSEEYGVGFNKELKNKIRKKYNNHCQECFRNEQEIGYKLIVHHIDFNKKNNEESNLICLCRSCHAQTIFNKEDWVEYYKKKVIM